MPKIEVVLNEKELEILNSLGEIEGKDAGTKLRNIYRLYLSSIPELTSKQFAIKRFEDKDEIDGILKEIFEIYKKDEYPVDAWDNEKIDKIIDELSKIHVLEENEGIRIVPSKFRDIFKMLIHDIATENKGMDEHVASLIAVIQLLTLYRQTIRDSAILLNEEWLYVFAMKMREAREFLKTKKLKLMDESPMISDE